MPSSNLTKGQWEELHSPQTLQPIFRQFSLEASSSYHDLKSASSQHSLFSCGSVLWISEKQDQFLLPFGKFSLGSFFNHNSSLTQRTLTLRKNNVGIPPVNHTAADCPTAHLTAPLELAAGLKSCPTPYWVLASLANVSLILSNMVTTP